MNLHSRDLPSWGAALLTASAGRKFVLVIDDFHHVRDKVTLAELTGLGRTEPALSSLCVLSGSTSDRVDGRRKVPVNVIEAKELLLGLDEIVGLAEAIGHAARPPGGRSACTVPSEAGSRWSAWRWPVQGRKQ